MSMMLLADINMFTNCSATWTFSDVVVISIIYLHALFLHSLYQLVFSSCWCTPLPERFLNKFLMLKSIILQLRWNYGNISLCHAAIKSDIFIHSSAIQYSLHWIQCLETFLLLWFSILLHFSSSSAFTFSFLFVFVVEAWEIYEICMQKNKKRKLVIYLIDKGRK